MGRINIRKKGNVYEYFFEGAKVNNKRTRISKSGFKTKAEAYEYGYKAYEEYQNGGIKKESQISYADYLNYWMKEYFEINFKYSTAKRYKESFETIKKELGRYKLCDITPFILNKTLLGLYQKTQTKETLRNYQKVIKSSLRDATYYFGFIGNDPAGSLQIPKILTFESKKNNAKHVYTIEEIEKILSRFKKNKTFICAFLTACYTGMRTGEVFALTWDDIDLENRTIKITKTVYAKDKSKEGRWYIGSTKTEGSQREVYICDTLYSILINYKEQQDKNKIELGKKYKYYSLKEIKNKYGKVVEYVIVVKNTKIVVEEINKVRNFGLFSMLENFRK